MGLRLEYTHKNRVLGDLTWVMPEEMQELFVELSGHDPRIRASIMLLMEDILSVQTGLLGNLMMKALEKPETLAQAHRKSSRRLRQLLKELNEM